jgi:hypothetical protein
MARQRPAPIGKLREIILLRLDAIRPVCVSRPPGLEIPVLDRRPNVAKPPSLIRTRVAPPLVGRYPLRDTNGRPRRGTWPQQGSTTLLRLNRSTSPLWR